MPAFLTRRFFQRALIAVALGALALGLVAWGIGRDDVARWIWAAGTVPVVLALLVSMVREFMAGRLGVDAVAFVSMSGALALGETLAGIVVAIMYAGGNVLEDVAVAHAERDLKSLVDRAPRVAHRRTASAVEDVPVEEVAVGDRVLVRAGEVIPVDGVITTAAAMIDEAALTGEPIPVARRAGELAQSGTLNAGETFEIRVTATAGESTYAGIVRMVTAAQTAKAPFIRMADRYALLLLPVTLVVAGGAWLWSGDAIRALAVLVAATPCPLILAAPVALIAGVSQAARRGILFKGGGPLEALAHASTVMFDKTGTLTVGGARLVAIETAPGEDPDEILRLAGSLEQASHHVVAQTIVEAATARQLALQVPAEVRETLGSGLEGMVGGRLVRVGSHQLVYGARKPEDWAVRALRRAAWRSALSVFVAIDGRTVGALLLADELRRDTPRAIQTLRTAGISRIVMLTGDRTDAAETIAAALDLDAVLADRVPADKVDAVATEQRLAPTVMVGDGINDAPALAAAGVGIAMGARGASASSEAADVVILVDRLDRVSDAVAIAKRARGIALQSIVAGMAMSGVAMLAAAAGWLPPVAGALDPGGDRRRRDPQRAARAADGPSARPPRHVGGRRHGAAPGPRADGIRGSTGCARSPMRSTTRDSPAAVTLIAEADRIVTREIVAHEQADETKVYPRADANSSPTATGSAR